jgi:transcriptional regulator with XRE-family HTH domain
MGVIVVDANDPSPVSDGVRSFIRDSGLTPYEIARRAGCSPQQLYRFLSGERGLSLEVLDRVCLALDLEIRRRA